MVFAGRNIKFLVVFTGRKSGRSSSGPNTLESVVNTAKNNLYICATLNKGVGMGELYVAEFSSMGPTLDGGIKPDIFHWGGN